jgi:hypothetical protein
MPEGGISKQYRQNRLQLPMSEGDKVSVADFVYTV